jgi:PncC family amidohydrolase
MHRILYSPEDLAAIREMLVGSHRTVAVAESVTAGLLQNAFSQAADARLFFQGGMTVYNVAQKCRQLHIEPIRAEQDNGVSERVAAHLADHITKAFCSQIGIGIVGYAAPVPERQVIKPFAYYAIYADDRLLDTGRIEGIDDTPLETQIEYVNAVIAAVRRLFCPRPALPKQK